MPAAAPRMATADALHRQPASGQRAVLAQSIERIFGAARRIAAAPHRPKQERLGRGKHPTIQAHAEYQNMLSRIHSIRPLAGFNNLALRSVVRKSRSTSAKPLLAMDGRATSTRSTGPAKSC